jgi:transposase
LAVGPAREHLRDFRICRLTNAAKDFPDQWFLKATHSRPEPMSDFAWMLREHEKGVLSYSNLPIHNGAVEAMNNIAKAISH